jgi:hypothetical protein
MNSRLLTAWMAAVVLLLVVFAERPAEAYVDPGSASYVFQLLVGTALGAVFALRMGWDRVKEFMRTYLPGSRSARE